MRHIAQLIVEPTSSVVCWLRVFVSTICMYCFMCMRFQFILNDWFNTVACDWPTTAHIQTRTHIADATFLYDTQHAYKQHRHRSLCAVTDVARNTQHCMCRSHSQSIRHCYQIIRLSVHLFRNFPSLFSLHFGFESQSNCWMSFIYKCLFVWFGWRFFSLFAECVCSAAGARARLCMRVYLRCFAFDFDSVVCGVRRSLRRSSWWQIFIVGSIWLALDATSRRYGTFVRK